MATTSAESAIRDYLAALRDPSSLRDDAGIESLRQQLDTANDLDRLRVRQQILDQENPSVQRYEDNFVTHAKAWADEHGITSKAFEAEGVPTQVLRRAGFGGMRGRRGGRRGGGGRVRTRVTVDEVRAAIPKGAFTVKALQEASGASPAVVRKVVQEEVAGGRLKEQGTDPDHQGPGRAPTLYKRGR